MEKKYEDFRLDINKYFYLLETSVMNPTIYASYLKTLSLNQSLIFFIINASLWLILSALIRTFLISKYHLFFGILSELLVLIIPMLFLLVFLSVILQVLAKIFGSRTKLKNNLKAVFYSTILLPFFAIPIFKVLAAIISFFVLIYCFKAINRFDRFRATVSVIIPVGIVLFTLYAMGILNISLLS